MRQKQLIDKRNKKLMKRFYELQAIKTPNGKRKYSYDYIYEKLGSEFYLSAYTVNYIIKNNV